MWAVGLLCQLEHYEWSVKNVNYFFYFVGQKMVIIVWLNV